MNVALKVRFDFNKVGQGLFYSGDIGRFNFVYDCGCSRDFLKKIGVKVIGPYKRRMDRKTIDLLVISHFHDDHTNGLQSLLRGVALNIVVLPYFAPIERLILALRSDFPRWYYNFLRDPVQFFLWRGAQKVIIVGGEEGEKGPLPIDIPPPEGGNNSDPKKMEIRDIDIERIYTKRLDAGEIDIEMSDNKNLEDTILSNDPEWKVFLGNKLLIKNHDKWITVSGVWIFRFFNYKVKDEEELTTFRTCLDEKGINPEDTDMIKETITNAKRRNKMKECYRETLNKNLNNTSLVVYRGPIGNNTSFIDINCEKGLSFDDCVHFYSSGRGGRCPYYNHNKMGHFLMGDIALKDNKYNELKTHYSSFFGTISLSQIPHHGSKENWKAHMLHDLDNCKKWVSSSGCPNKYRHPHREVILDILTNERCFCWSNQYNRFSMEGKVV